MTLSRANMRVLIGIAIGVIWGILYALSGDFSSWFRVLSATFGLSVYGAIVLSMLDTREKVQQGIIGAILGGILGGWLLSDQVASFSFVMGILSGALVGVGLVGELTSQVSRSHVDLIIKLWQTPESWLVTMLIYSQVSAGRV